MQQQPESQTPAKGGMSSRVLKVMSIFGSVQVVTIICSIVRVKLVALWIGPAGIGLYGIFNSALEMINNTCQLGLRSSAVRDLAAADSRTLPATVLTVRRLGWLLGLAGAVLTVCLSVPMSLYAFGDKGHAWCFCLLAAVVLLASLTASESAVFQGLKRFRRLARGMLWGAVGGLAVSIPMFRLWGIDSILPSIVAYGVCSWLAIGMIHEKVAPPQQRITMRQSLSLGKKMLILSAYLTACEFITAVVTFVFVGWLNKEAGEAQTGFFQAGFTIVNRYVGLVFTAIAVEYYPRLSQVIHSRARTRLFVSHEMGLIMLILIPVVTWFIAADKLLVRFLYNSEFYVILPFVTWGIVGTVLRAFSWCLSFSILAKGDGKAFLWTEALSAVFYLGANMLFYKQWGIAGMGAAYALWYGLYSVAVGVVYFRKFGFTVSGEGVKITLMTLAATVAAAAARIYLGWEAAAVVAVVASAWSLHRLRVSFLKGAPGLGAILRGRRGPRATR